MSRITPYVPMHPKTPEVPMSRMQEILARNTARVEVKIEPPPREPLKWEKPVKTSAHGAGYVLTTCGLYSISKDGHEMGFSYTAWKRNTTPATNLGCVRTREEAEKLCEAAR